MAVAILLIALLGTGYANEDDDKLGLGTCNPFRQCDRTKIRDLFVQNYILEDDATLDNGNATDRARRMNEYSDFLNDTFFTDDIIFINVATSSVTEGKEEVIADFVYFVALSRDVRHTNGLLNYDFVSCKEVIVRETHRTIGVLPDFSVSPPVQAWFRGDDTVELTFVRIKGRWKVNKFVSSPRADADLEQWKGKPLAYKKLS